MPRFDLDCAAIAGLTDVGALIDEPLVERDPIAVYASVGADLPRITFVEAMGGINCEWSNGVGHASSTNTPLTYRGVEVSILPDAEEQWARFVSIYGEGESRYCNSPGSVHCGLDTLVNGYWISATLTGVVSGTVPVSDEVVAEAGAFFDSLATAVAGLGAPATAWTPPSSTIALPADCESFLSAAEVASLVGIGEELYVMRGHGGWSIWAGARVESGADSCSWVTADEYSVGSIDWLPAGAWAAEHTLPVTTAPEGPVAVTVDGLAVSDSAYLRCGSYCTVDLVVGGNWVQIRGFGGSDYLANPMDARDTALTIATAVVSRLYS